jgi:UDP-N-acetylglucosamine transferase subunit ALG13
LIFVTVGTHYLGFKRLIEKMDEISSKSDEEIIAQIGSTNYKPTNMKYYNYIDDEKKLFDYYKKSRVIIAHAGAGTLLNLLYLKKPIIVVPRLKKYNECIDNHQLELSEVLNKKGSTTVVYDVEKLEHILKNYNFNNSNHPESNNLVTFLKKYVG